MTVEFKRLWKEMIMLLQCNIMAFTAGVKEVITFRLPDLQALI
jgi:hypothetical protein